MTTTAKVKHDQVQKPWLFFVDVATPEGTQRFVDFAEEDLEITQSTVAFDGQEYWPIKMDRDAEENSDDLSGNEFTLRLHEPTYKLAGIARRNSFLENQSVTIRRIRSDLLSTPSEAITTSHKVRVVELGSARVNLILGFPTTFDQRFPRRFWTRDRCWNDWHRRFVEGNACRYPSDDFNFQTQQDLRKETITAALTERRHGWFVLNADRTQLWAAGRVSPSGCKWEVDGSTSRWDQTQRESPYMFKLLSEGDFDVWCEVRGSADNNENDWRMGLLIQDPLDARHWIFWGGWGDGDPITVTKYYKRIGLDASIQETSAASGDDHYRIERSGGTFKLYSKDILETTWNLRYTETPSWTPAMGDNCRVGAALISNTNPITTPLAAFVSFVRFTAGGFTDCNRLITDCSERKNLIQFNGFERMPDFAG